MLVIGEKERAFLTKHLPSIDLATISRSDLLDQLDTFIVVEGLDENQDMLTALGREAQLVFDAIYESNT